jgi:hypothetical protein
VGRTAIALCLAVVCVAARPQLARATACAPPPGAEVGVGAIDGGERLRWIERRLSQEASRSKLWAGAWAIGIGAAGLGSLVPVPFVAAGDRIDWYTSAATAAIGVIPFVVSAPAVTRDAPKLRAAIATMPQNDDRRICTLLVDAERKLAADAADERWQQGWWTHAGNVVFNTGVLLFLGLAYHHWTAGIINGISGAVVGETIILTQPTGTIGDLGAYNRGELSVAAGYTGSSRSMAWIYTANF